MKTLYLDIFSGISGDMFLGAMIDLGVDAKALEAELAKLNLDGYQLHVSRKSKANIEGVKSCRPRAAITNTRTNTAILTRTVTMTTATRTNATSPTSNRSSPTVRSVVG